ncbi:MAG: glycosyltransferase family 4 protein [Bauldia sp.]|nr:glycosyltransferase family 4 protein [Bauldia sp.]
MRVLIPVHDERTFPALFKTYADMGHEVVLGVPNLTLRAARFDLIHIHWPEALAGWQTPTTETLDRIVADLDWWRGRCPVVATVHNLAPHGRFESAVDRALFARVYEACHLITHFSAYSRDELVRLHPGLANARHLVHRPFLYTNITPFAVGRTAARERLGLRDGDFLIAAMGIIRERHELDLLEEGIRQARVPGKRVMLTTRFTGGRRRDRLRRRVWRFLSGRAGLASGGPLPEPALATLCEAADVVVIQRYPPHLNSGVMQLAMTFGTPMAAPAYGVYLEYLGDSGCVLYPPKDAAGLARAIERIASEDRHALIRRNLEVVRDWGWDRNVSAILAELGVIQGRGEDAIA